MLHLNEQRREDMSNQLDFEPEAEALREQLVAWRRDFHTHPELAFQEHRSAGLIADRLRGLGII